MEVCDEDEVVKMRFFINSFFSKCDQVHGTVLHFLVTFKSQGYVQVDKEMCCLQSGIEIII